MKQKFSKFWIASKQPRKQRKYLANAPIHIKRKLLSSHLSKDLNGKYKKRSVVLRKGDNVRVMRGSFKKKAGKVALINMKKMKVSIEGLQRSKKDGSKVNVLFHPSDLMITELNLDDKKRFAEKNETKTEKKEEKKEIKVGKIDKKLNNKEKNNAS